jgi:hypothetical protein
MFTDALLHTQIKIVRDIFLILRKIFSFCSVINQVLQPAQRSKKYNTQIHVHVYCSSSLLFFLEFYKSAVELNFFYLLRMTISK